MNIFALSSGKGPSGIAIVRISGPQTLDICKSLTDEKNIESLLKTFFIIKQLKEDLFLTFLILKSKQKLI